jgi:hypothetical protein
MVKKEKRIIIASLIISIIATTTLILLADTPDKVYLNPPIGDIVVLIAAGFLLVDSFKYINHRRLYSTVLRIMIGTSMLTTHIMQFALDMIKHIKF